MKNCGRACVPSDQCTIQSALDSVGKELDYHTSYEAILFHGAVQSTAALWLYEFSFIISSLAISTNPEELYGTNGDALV